MSQLCERPSKLYLFENAFRSFFSVIATHILAGQVDALLCDEEEGDLLHLLKRLWWFARYFNPLNLAWRYYSILAFRCMRGPLSRKQIALINFECYPYGPPIPYVQGEAMPDYSVKRLEISGVFSSQGMLSFIAAYQGFQAVQFTLSGSGFGFLPNITKAMAILGLFRVLVSPWIANKVHVEAKAYTGMPPVAAFAEDDCKVSKALAVGWAMVLVCLAGLSMRSYVPFPPNSTVPTHLIDRSIELLYNYVSVTALAFHGHFLFQRARAVGNRHPLFDHWLYHLQTALFLLLLAATVIVGIVDFVQHDFYWNCFY